MLVLGIGLFPFCLMLFAIMRNSTQIVGSTTIAPGLLRKAVDSEAMLNQILCFLPICIFCTTPYLTLISRSTIAAVIFSVFIPMALVTAGATLLSEVIVKLGLAVQYGVINSAALATCFVVFYWLGYSKFKKLQVIDMGAGELPFSGYLEAPFQLLLNTVFSSGRGGW